MIELRLVHSLLDKEVFESVTDTLKPSIFSDDNADIVEAIISLHGEFEVIDLDIVHEHLRNKKVSTRSKMALLDEIMNEIRLTEPVGADVAKQFIFNLARKSSRLDALNALAQVIEKNEDSHASVTEILDATDYEESSDKVDTCLGSLLEHYSTSGRFHLSVDALQTGIGGLQRKNVAVYFGRPEVGKSSLLAFDVAGWLKSGIRVDYYANEEPAKKIILNIVRAACNMTDADIAMHIKHGSTIDIWEEIRHNLTVREVGDMDIDMVFARAKKDTPDVVCLDQIDKMTIHGNYNNSADRLKALYERSRTIAKTADCLVCNVSQASAEAEGMIYPPYSMLENSKTGKAGEADIIFGIGKYKDTPNDRQELRGVCVSKNKINGWHGEQGVMFDRHSNQWIARGEDNDYSA